MFGLGTQELLIILVIALMLFGVGKLPQIGTSLGKGIHNFKKGMIEDEGEDAQTVAVIEGKNNES